MRAPANSGNGFLVHVRHEDAIFQTSEAFRFFAPQLII